MFDFIASIFNNVFNKTFWLLVIVVSLIVGSIVQCVESVSDKAERSKLNSEIEDGKTDEAAQRLHEKFMEDYNGDTAHVTKRAGVQAEKVIAECLKQGDVENAKMIFSEYKHGLSAYERPRLYRYMVKHGMEDAEDYQ